MQNVENWVVKGHLKLLEIDRAHAYDISVSPSCTISEI